MKLGIISDTHNQIDLIKKALEVFKNEKVGMIIHAGDMDLAGTFGEFKEVGVPIKMAIGNIDEEPERFLEEAKRLNLDFFMNTFLTVDVGRSRKDVERRIFVFHGNVRGKLDRVIKTLVESKKYEVIIHGHTHIPRNERVGGVLVLNPGSLTPLSVGIKPSVAVYDLRRGEARIIEI